MVVYRQRALTLVICFLLFFITSTQSFSADTDTGKTVVLATYSSRPMDKPYGPFAVHKYLFEKLGYTLEFRYVPAKRMPYSLRSGAIDAYPSSQLRRGIELEHLGHDGFVQVHYPETVTDIHIYYKRSSKWAPSWPPNDDFIKNARGVSLNYNYLGLTGFDILQIGDYSAGLKMINYGRADFWVDGIRIAPELAPLVKTESDGYFKQHLTKNALYLTLRDDEKGQALKAAWDKEFKNLFSDPLLFKEIYLEFLPGKRSLSLGGYMEFLQNNFPEFELVDASL